jgi:hypothetical protein
VIAHLKSLSLKGHATSTLNPLVKLHQSKLDLSLTIHQLKHNKHRHSAQSKAGQQQPTIHEGTAMAKATLNILKAQLLMKNTACFITTICKLFSLRKKSDQSIAAYFTELDGLITLTVVDTNEDVRPSP